MLKKFIFITFFFFTAQSFASENIRVLIVKNVDKLVAGGESVTVYLDRQFADRFETGSNKVLLITSDKQSIYINRKDTFAKQVHLQPKNGFISLNGMEVRDNASIYLMPDGTLSVVNRIDIEDYLMGVINGEISSSWPSEAVKAQVVASRTYALFQKSINTGNYYDLETTFMHQVYGGTKNEDVPSAIAVFQTKGEVLKNNGGLIEAFFHSNCGGMTESAKNYFNKDIDYLISTYDEHCKNSPAYYWRIVMSEAEIEKKLKGELGKIKKINASLKNSSGRVSKVIITGSKGTKELTGKDFRALMGYSVIKSTLFTVSKDTNYFIFSGRGSGHGVGLCQWGSKGMALKGVKYKDILNFYYNGAEVVKIDEN